MARKPPAGTVARGQLFTDRAFYGGVDDAGEPLSSLPALPEEVAVAWWEPGAGVSRPLLERGRERYGIFCAPCHDQTGSGNGMIVRRGYQQPESFHVARLREAEVGYLFDVMTNGFGQMPSYAMQVPPADRWAIAAYVKVLQLAGGARLAEMPAAERRAAEAAANQADAAAAAPMPAPGDDHGGAHGGAP